MQCSHKKEAIPKHKERGKTIKYGKLYDMAGLRHKNLQENWGEITRSINCAFREDLIDQVFNPDNFVKVNAEDIQYHIKSIHCCIDPNGGGKSRTAIALGYLNENTKQIVVSNFIFYSTRNSHVVVVVAMVLIHVSMFLSLI